jgi:hypothetical protein
MSVTVVQIYCMQCKLTVTRTEAAFYARPLGFEEVSRGAITPQVDLGHRIGSRLE